MRTFKTLSLAIVIAWTLAGCKTTYVPKLSEPTTYAINSSLPEDSTIIRYYTPFKQQLDQEMNRTIGYSTRHLTKSRSDAESLAGNFFADALLAMGKKIDPEAQLSLATKGGIRSEVKQGDVTIGSMFELMPFENTVTILELSAKDLAILADFIAKTGGQPIAGFTVKIKEEKAAEIRIDGKEIDPTRSYKLVTYDYLANGGDYIEGITHPLKRTDSSLRVREGLIEYVQGLTKAGKNINTELDGRVSIIK
ncbi:5'-nucleotidase, C-terminal domain [Sphingobacterium nematocida]|uniref:5'-nucleotidase, C-terminal domain n=1 Tax=Sphingobacterium nematocida TaxID=1513896 RepID=A0A1T5F468_9SPHI|nr:5'-nucleotidase C-terminal domain-containing protein [Sphingobacterium nematocida]SKB90995.1 5'-nucleotidase, C-terminal domain [Sphingobacterium nematocida]